MTKRNNLAIFSLLMFSAASHARAADRNELERLAADLGRQHMTVSTATQEIGSARSELTFDGCDVHWQSQGNNNDSYVNCHVQYEDQYFHGHGDVTVTQDGGRVALHLRWEDGSTYSVHLDLDLTRDSALTWSGSGELAARYRFQIWNGKWWQVDLHGRSSI